MSLRDGVLPSKQSPVTRGDCFATCARNDMPRARLALLWHRGSRRASAFLACIETQSATGEELRLRTLLPSVLDKAFKGEL